MSRGSYASITFRPSDVRKYKELRDAIRCEFGTTEGEKLQDGMVMFDSSEARDGVFPAIEEIAQSLAVPFDRYSGEAYEVSEQTVCFRPGDGVTVIQMDGDGEPVVPLERITGILMRSKGDDAMLRRTFEALVGGFDVVPLAKFPSA